MMDSRCPRAQGFSPHSEGPISYSGAFYWQFSRFRVFSQDFEGVYTLPSLGRSLLPLSGQKWH